MPSLALVLMQVAVVLATSKLVGRVFTWIGQPEVMGEITAGILLGPSLLGVVAPRVMHALFPPSGLVPLYAFSQLGLVLFMFMVGLEMQPRLLRNAARVAIVASQASIVVPFACGVAIAIVLRDELASGVAVAPFALFVGAAMAVTAFPVLARILTDRNLMHTRVGMFALSCAAVDDVTAWWVLGAITVIARGGSGVASLATRFATLAAYVALMIFVVRPLLARMLPATERPTRLRFSGVMLLILVSAWATEALEVHALFGAFVAGAVMPRGEALATGLRDHMESLAVVLLLPLFFAYNGLRTSIGLLNTTHLWLVCATIVVVAIASKLLTTASVIRTSGMSWRESLAVGALVNTRGLVELVILNVGVDLGILPPVLFSMMVIMALATTMMAAPLLDLFVPGLGAGEEAHAIG